MGMMTTGPGAWGPRRRPNLPEGVACPPGVPIAWSPVHLSSASAQLGQVLLELIDLLDHVDRDDDRVLLEPEERLRIVEQDVGVQHEAAAVDVPRTAVGVGGSTPLGGRSRTLAFLA